MIDRKYSLVIEATAEQQLPVPEQNPKPAVVVQNTERVVPAA
jgi:hypothetical protein